MIFDSLSQAAFYRPLDPGIARALDFLGSADLARIATGRHELDGDRLFALVQEYETRPPERCVWEAHRRYRDVQYIASGVERMGCAEIGRMRIREPYDADRDVAFFDGDGDFVTVVAGMFIVFSPQDVHMPGIAAGAPGLVRKVVIKVAVALP